MLVTGLVRELLEPGLDVVLGHFFTAADGIEIHDSFSFLGSFDFGGGDFCANSRWAFMTAIQNLSP